MKFQLSAPPFLIVYLTVLQILQIVLAQQITDCGFDVRDHAANPPLVDPITLAGSDRPCNSDPGNNANNIRNGIGDFCVVIRPQGVAVADRPSVPLGDATAETTCYPNPNPQNPPPQNPPPLFHAAGKEKNWDLLNHLTRYFAQSYQLFDDLPYVSDKVYENNFLRVVLSPRFPELPPPDVNRTSARKLRIPLPNAPNPYFIEVTGISYKGELLHNFLHFRIFANMSVALGKGQLKRDSVLHGKGAEKGANQEFPNFASGRISALVLMVKDQDGWPVGDFSTPVPCDRTCYKYSHDVHYGDKRNAVPCSYTPPYASTHPGMFIYDADPGRYCTHFSDLNRIEKPEFKNRQPPAGGGNPAADPFDPRWYPETARMEGVREVHATWSFSHDTCNFVSKLYIQSLIFEDVEQVLPVRFYPADNNGGGIQNFVVAAGTLATPTPVTDYKPTLFGWSAQYNVLKPTRNSLGAADYANLRYLMERDSRYNEINCHVPLFDAVNATRFTFRKGSVPNHESGKDQKIPSRAGFHALMSKWFQTAQALRYFGDYRATYPNSNKLCRIKPSWANKPGELNEIKDLLVSPAEEGMRCPCPALPSEEPIENRTADPARLHGRLIHASHMAIAYMFLTPIGCFVARYYKETYVTVFCFQEYWWYMWHVCTLIVACLFNVGAITSIARKKTNEIKYNENLIIHVVLGAISIFVFYMEIFTGFFRVASPKKRMRQIFMHWLIGTMNNACAVMSMFAMAWVDQSGFSCSVAGTMTVWIVFVVICYGIMEYNMRRVDKKLRLVPRRSYLPPPVKRLFTKEPPGRGFRMTMLAVFIIGLVIIQGFVSYFIWNVEGGASCHEERDEARRNSLRNALSSG